MSLPFRTASQDAQPFRSALFASARVQLDEQRWSPSFAARLSTWAAATTTLIVMDGGQAMLSERRSALPFAERVRQEWGMAYRSVPSPRVDSRPEGMCAAFRFTSEAATPALALESALTDHDHDRAPSVGLGVASDSNRLVRLSPVALFRYFWRRQAITLGYVCAELDVEADAIALLRHVVSRATSSEPATPRAELRQRASRRSLALAAQAVMATAVAEPHPLAELAGRLDTSPFHLARVFRAELGVSLHQHLLQLRLAAALGRLREGAANLSMLALELGFSHHSHFSVVFREAIGWSPSEVRRMLTAETVADLGIPERRCG